MCIFCKVVPWQEIPDGIRWRENKQMLPGIRHFASQMCSMAHCDFPHKVDYTLKVCARIKVYPLRSLYQRSHHSNRRRNQDPTYPQVSRLHSLPSYSCEVLLHLCSLFAVCSSLLIDLILFLNEACTITKVPQEDCSSFHSPHTPQLQHSLLVFQSKH